ncbi:MAG: hypothetical protein MRERV_11c066 [Mycoplasmataceae bacterium RV_VA103A]|nr:MAG: hypothetical protein MRERV_11c066 [Mycoplasmataceae bacterium RV_VA103A]
MSYITKTSKNVKFDNNYNEIVKNLSLILDEKETDDTKKKSKKLSTLLDESAKLTKEKAEKQQQITKKTSKKNELKHLILHQKGVEREKARILGQTVPNMPSVTTDKSAWNADDGAWNSFHGKKADGSATTNHYDWDDRIKTFYAATYKDNLYKVKGENFHITEDEAIKLLSRIIYELGRIKKADFAAKHNLTGADKTAIETQLDRLIEQSTAIKEMNEKGASSKDLAKKTWDLPQTYSKEIAIGTNTPRVANPFNFNDLDFVAKLNDTLVNSLDQSDITKSEEWTINKSGDAYTEEELADYGITVSDSSKTTLYKSIKKVGDEWVKAGEHKVKVENGLKGWIELFKLVFEDADNQAKIKASFSTTPNPVQQLFTDLRSQGAVDANFNTHYRLPESADALDDLIAQLEADKTVSAVTNADLAKEIQELKKVIAEKESEIISKKSGLDGLVGEILSKKREALAKHNINKGFAKTASEDNRRDIMELLDISQLLLEIRYLENDGDATALSSVDAENTALTTVEDITTKLYSYNGDCRLVERFYDLAFVGGDNKLDASQAISRIKAGKYKDKDGEHDISFCGGLEKFKECFENKEKLVKLTEWELEALQAINKTLNGENAEEKLSDWQSKLKTLDPALDDTIITDAWKSKWGQVKKHNKLTQVETLIKKVFGSDGKIKSEFLEEIKKSDATLVDLKTLLLKEPKDIITYIACFVYNQLDDSAPEEKNKKKTQMKRRIAKKLNKTNDQLTDEELNESLYQIEIGEMILDTKFYKADLSEITNQPEQNEEPKWYQWGSTMGKVLYIGGPLLLVGGLMAVIFRKKIKNWFNGPAEEEGQTTDIPEDREEDDKE